MFNMCILRSYEKHCSFSLMQVSANRNHLSVTQVSTQGNKTICKVNKQTFCPTYADIIKEESFFKNFNVVTNLSLKTKHITIDYKYPYINIFITNSIKKLYFLKYFIKGYLVKFAIHIKLFVFTIYQQ